MKSILLLCTFLISALSFANSDVQSFIFDGSDLSKSVTVTDAVYRTEYRNEQRPAVCYRTVITGHTTQCQNVQTGTTCSTVNGQRVCRPVYQQQCRRVPVYGRQAYTCFRTITVAYQVLDHYTQANVNFSFAAAPAGVMPFEKITVSLDGDYLSSRVKSSGKVAMIYTKQENSRMDGRNIIKDVQYKVNLVDLQKALLPSQGKIKLISSSADQLIIESGEIPSGLNYVYALKLTKVKFLRKDPVLFEGSLPKDAIEFEAMNGRTLIKVDLSKLTQPLEKGRFKAEFSIALKLPAGSLLNTDIPDLEFKMKKKFRIK